jgi:hypothetical protein
MRIKAILIFVMHQVSATLGVGFGAGSVAFFIFGLLRPLNPELFSTHNMYEALTRLPYFPIQIPLAFWWGWALSRRFRHRSMLWVWVLPLLVLCYVVVEMPATAPGFTSAIALANIDQHRLSHYFGWGCRFEDRCIDQLTFTMPFYASAAYSIGALLARKMRRSTGAGNLTESPI